ncbi:hypothetical protein BHE74_00050597 [Ensete ventricosum]|nr:hypothetical protein BHE74_00050597 [Ensete ventricosum]
MGEKERKKDEQKVAFHRLFAFADSRDVALMAIGTVSAVGNGVSMPIMTLIFGELIDAFGYADNSTVLHQVNKFVQLLSTFFGGFIIAFAKGWLLALVMLSCLPPIAIAGAVMSWMIAKLSSRGQVAYSEAGNVVEQAIGSIRTVVDAGRCRLWLRHGFRLHGYLLQLWPVHMNKAMNSRRSLGETSPCISAFAAGRAAAYRMFETIKRQPEIDANDTSGVVLEDVNGEIELKDVYFSYPTRPEQLVFNGLSLRVPSGTTMAIVGESGSGKSTVISLVERFYDPQAGEVLIDGINLKKLRLRHIRGKIGLVSQEPVLFTATIKENIAYGKEGATLEEIKRATELANAARFIDKLPNVSGGLDTAVGEHGTQLSGGQKQRIAIARAILKDPKILLLDEATSALDTESERIVQEALSRIMSQITTIVVAHRLSTVRNADTITVLHEGRVVEQGPHSTLVNDPNGAYSQLIRLQELRQEGEEEPSDDHGRLSSNNDAATKSASKSFRRTSLSRSISRGSSFGRSSRRSFTTGFGLPGSIEIQDEESGVDGGKQGQLEPRRDVPIKRLVYLNKPEAPVLFIGSVAAAVHGVLFPIFSILISSAIKTFFQPPHELRKNARFWALMYTVLGIVALLSVPIQYFFFGVAGGKLVERIRSLSFKKVVHQEISWFDEPSNSRSSLATLSYFVLELKHGFCSSQSSSVLQWCNRCKAISRCCDCSEFGGRQPGLDGAEPVNSHRRIPDRHHRKLETDFGDYSRHSIGRSSRIRSDQVPQGVQCRCQGNNQLRCVLASSARNHTENPRLQAMYEQASQVASDAISSIRTVFFALTMASLSVSQTSALGPDSTKAKDSVASIFAILDRKSSIDSSSDEGMILDNVKGTIELQHVSFKYPSRPDSGSGKSTAIALLERFYDPDSGSVLLDGVDIKELKVRWLRQQMGLVSQEPVLFNDTIRANIAYGKEGEVSEKEIVAAVEIANAHQFISGLPQGYDTTVGERGIQLSGGQKQRVAIARAILKDPRILLLDEATSALDAESEHAVQEALDRAAVGRSTLIVAHRLSTIKGADTIAVLKNGVIVEKGRHEALIDRKDGVYASLLALYMSSN